MRPLRRKPSYVSRPTPKTDSKARTIEKGWNLRAFRALTGIAEVKDISDKLG